MLIAPRRLSEAEYKATLGGRMVDIKGREETIHPDGVIVLAPYLRAAAADLAPLELLADAEPAAVYHASDSRFDHVVYPCNRSNVYLVVIVASGRSIHGHYVLDLPKEHGGPPDAADA